MSSPADSQNIIILPVCGRIFNNDPRSSNEGRPTFIINHPKIFFILEFVLTVSFFDVFEWSLMRPPDPAAEGFVYSAVESPKGELGVYLQGNGDSLPYRVRIRAPRMRASG